MWKTFVSDFNGDSFFKDEDWVSSKTLSLSKNWIDIINGLNIVLMVKKHQIRMFVFSKHFLPGVSQQCTHIGYRNDALY